MVEAFPKADFPSPPKGERGRGEGVAHQAPAPEAVFDALRDIPDPEMPISIVDLGIVDDVRADDSGRVEIDLLPTFVGCPALELIESQVRAKASALPGVSAVDVHIKYDPPWSVDRISAAGRETLRHFGVTVPHAACHSQPSAEPTCPFCGSDRVHLESSFGPTRCRMIYHCDACQHPFEHLKRLPLVTLGA